MKWLLVAVGAIVALALLVVVVGLFTPKTHEALVSARLGKSPAEVWAVITDFPSQPQWNAEVTKVEPLPDRDGKAVWRETYGGFPATLVSTVVEPPTRLVREIQPGGPFHGSWTWELAPEGDGTRLTVTERGTVENPFFRGMMAFGDKSKTARKYVEALGRRLGTEVTP